MLSLLELSFDRFYSEFCFRVQLHFIERNLIFLKAQYVSLTIASHAKSYNIKTRDKLEPVGDSGSLEIDVVPDWRILPSMGSAT